MKFRLFLFLCFSAIVFAGCGNDVNDSVGAPCDTTRDCPAPATCLTGKHYPDGFCSVSCNHSNQCPSDTACVDQSDGVCLFRCNDDRDCPTDWKCKKKELEENDDLEVHVCIGK